VIVGFPIPEVPSNFNASRTKVVAAACRFADAPAVVHDSFAIVAYDTVGQDKTRAHQIVLFVKLLALVLFKSTIAFKHRLGAILHNLIRFHYVLLNISQSGIAHEVVVDAMGVVRVNKRER
jgi:hypothetical protein